MTNHDDTTVSNDQDLIESAFEQVQFVQFTNQQ
jgi:hypothetical protein